MDTFIADMNWRVLRYHLWGWVLFISYEQGYILYTNGLGSIGNFVYFYTCNISLFYCHILLLDKTVGVNPPRYIKAILMTALELLVFLVIKGAREYFLTTPEGRPVGYSAIFRVTLILDAIRNLFFMGLATLVWSLYQLSYSRKKNAVAAMLNLELARDKAETEARLAKNRVAYLRQQMNPHLLFNTLSYIYGSVFKHAPESSNAVLLLSDIMRYSLSDAGSDEMVPLCHEVEQVNNLIELNRYRFHYPLPVSFEISGEIDRYRILPLVLITLSENVFKHGDIENHAAAVRLNVNAQGLLVFTTHNSKIPDAVKEQRSGLGIESTRLRLEYAYPSAHALVISETADTFTITLTLQV